MKTLITVILGSLVITGCATTGLTSQLGYAVIYGAAAPIAATASPNRSKVGRACARNFLGLFAAGDASIERAARDGEIKTISTVDQETFAITLIYGQVCTVVRGE